MDNNVQTVIPADAGSRRRLGPEGFRKPLNLLRRATPQRHAHPEAQEARSKLILTYLFAFAFAVILLFVSHTFETDRHYLPQMGAALAKDLGIAGIVAIVIAITLERLSTQEFTRLARAEKQAMKKDIFEYVYGYHVPEEIRKEIHEKVLTAKFVRNRTTLNYRLTPLQAEGGSTTRWMKVTLVASYEIQNLTNHPQEYHLKAVLEKPPVPSVAEHVKFLSLSVVDSIPSIGRFDAVQLQKTGWITEDNVCIILEPPRPVVSPKRPMVVKVGYSGICHLEGGCDYFTFKDHSCVTEISAEVVGDFSVELRDFGGEELRSDELFTEGNNEQGTNRFRWVSDTPMLRNQGVFIAWFPKRPVDAQSDLTGETAGR